MQYASGGAFRQALEQRLLSQSRASGLSLSWLRKRVAFDRLLARLVAVSPDRWVLKGALALEYRLGPSGRPTKDADLVRLDDEQQATADFLAAQALDLCDHFTLDIERDPATATPDAAALRYRVRVELAGRPFEAVFVDVGFVDPLHWPPDLVRGSDVLGFAGIAPVSVPVLAIEQHVAEKVHAYTRRYAGDEPSSRPKDLVDIVLVQASIPLDARRLHLALEGIFAVRALQPIPPSLPPPPVDWQVAYRRMAVTVGIPDRLDTGYQIARQLLDPVLAGLSQGRWDPGECRWHRVEA